MLVDSHCHLENNEKLGDIMIHAADAGVALILDAGSNLDHLEEHLQIAEKYAFVYTAAGAHPHQAKEFSALTAEDILCKIRHNKITGYGYQNEKWSSAAVLFVAGYEFAYGATNTAGSDVSVRIFAYQASGSRYFGKDEFTGRIPACPLARIPVSGHELPGTGIYPHQCVYIFRYRIPYAEFPAAVCFIHC